MSLVTKERRNNWKQIADYFEDKSSSQCMHRYLNILAPGLKFGPWTSSEDAILLKWVKENGPTKWSMCGKFVGGRNAKQCRERWMNSLDPNIKKTKWDIEEDYKIFNLFFKVGAKWSKYSQFLPNRTENAIKNRFYSSLRKEASSKEFGNGQACNLTTDELLKFVDCTWSKISSEMNVYQRERSYQERISDEIDKRLQQEFQNEAEEKRFSKVEILSFDDVSFEKHSLAEKMDCMDYAIDNHDSEITLEEKFEIFFGEFKADQWKVLNMGDSKGANRKVINSLTKMEELIRETKNRLRKGDVSCVEEMFLAAKRINTA